MQSISTQFAHVYGMFAHETSGFELGFERFAREGIAADEYIVGTDRLRSYHVVISQYDIATIIQENAISRSRKTRNARP